MKLRSRIFIVVPITMMLLLTGCKFDTSKMVGSVLDVVLFFLSDGEDEQGETTEDFVVILEEDIQEEAERVAGVMRDAFIAKDVDAVKELFSDYTQEKYDLDSEIEDVFEFIDGDIVSVGKIHGGYGGGNSSAKYGETKTIFQGDIYEMVTDTGKSYSVYFTGLYYSRLHDDMIGVNMIYISDDAIGINRSGKRPGGELWIGRDI